MELFKLFKYYLSAAFIIIESLSCLTLLIMTLINVDIHDRLHPLRKIKKISYTFEHRINELINRSTSVRLYLIIFPQANNVDPDLVP